MLVVDTSAILHALIGKPRDERLARRLSEDGDLHAPHLIDVELLHALRGLLQGGKLGPERVQDVRTGLRELTIVRYPHSPLADRAWDLRHNLTVCDGVFIALSEALGAVLVTCDAAMASVPGSTAMVELYGTPDARLARPARRRETRKRER